MWGVLIHKRVGSLLLFVEVFILLLLGASIRVSCFLRFPGLRKSKWANVVSYGAVISACAGSAKWEVALHLLELLGEQHLQPTITTCNAAMTACEKAGQWCRALQFLEDLQRWRLREDDVSYGAVISACAAGSEWEVAQALLNSMQSRRIRASIITRNAAISACEKAGAWQQAFRLLQSTEDSSPKRPQKHADLALLCFFFDKITLSICMPPLLDPSFCAVEGSEL